MSQQEDLSQPDNREFPPTETTSTAPNVFSDALSLEEMKEVQARVSEARINKAVADILGKDETGAYDSRYINIADGIDDQSPAAKQKLIEKRSRFPYYKEFYGRECLAILKIIKDSKKNRIIKNSNYPNLARGSIYNRISQGIYYVEDHLDPQGEWRTFLKTIEVCKVQGGILFKILDQLSESPLLTEEAPDEVATFGKLKSHIRNIIENMPVNSKYILPDAEMKDIFLTLDQIDELEFFFLNSPDLLAKVKKDSIMILKPSVEAESKGV